jgi:ABC-type antimicrobial peptide transport system permease subunit
LITGREFSWTDLYDQRPVAMVSENTARELWGDATAAIGKRVRPPGPPGPWREIIGVTEDVRDSGVQQSAPTIVYWPTMTQNFFGNPVNVIRSVAFVIRSRRTGSEAFLNEVRSAVWSVNQNLPLAGVRSMDDIYERSMASTSFTLAMLAIAGSMALLLGVVGIYGVISYTVSQRTREIGIRIALGARNQEVRRMFVRNGMMLAGIGAAIGLLAAVALTRLMSSLLFGIGPLDPIAFGLAPVVLVAAATLASYVPARRATLVDPLEALRQD